MTDNPAALSYSVAALDDELSALVRERRRTTLPARRHDIDDQIDEKLERRLTLTVPTVLAAA